MLSTSLFWLKLLPFLQFILQISGLSSLTRIITWPFCIANSFAVSVQSRLSVSMVSFLTQSVIGLALRKAQEALIPRGLVKPLGSDLLRIFWDIPSCSRKNDLLRAAWRWLPYLARAHLIAFLLWVLKSASTMSWWTDCTIRVLTESLDQKAEKKYQHKTQLKSGNFLQKQSEEPGTQDVVSPAKPVLPPAIRIPYISLSTSPPIVDGDQSSESSSASTSTTALLTETSSEFTPFVSFLPDHRLSTDFSDTICDSSHVLTFMDSMQDDPFCSFDCNDAFMSYLSLHEVSGKSTYGLIYRGTGYRNEQFAVKIVKRDGISDHDSAFVHEIAALERVGNSDWAPRLRYWQCSKEYLLIAMVNRFASLCMIIDSAGLL